MTTAHEFAEYERRVANDLVVLHQNGSEAPTKLTPHQPVTAINFDDFLTKNLPPRETLLAPWLPLQGLAMIHAPRGIGKTHLALGTAWAVASGGGFLRWTTPAGARRVLLLDGEMPGVLLQERLARVAGVSERTPIMPEYLRIAAADLVRDGLPDLSDPASQKFYADIIADADLVIVDNLSTLCRGLKENEADSWTPVQNWGLLAAPRWQVRAVHPSRRQVGTTARHQPQRGRAGYRDRPAEAA